jgi:AMMECR1 domain-containing protein
VDVLSELERVSDLAYLNPKEYGVIVHSKGKMGVLLPDLEGVDTVEAQLKIASNKAGFKVEEIEYMERFSVERYT